MDHQAAPPTVSQVRRSLRAAFSRGLNSVRRPLRSQRGVALLIALFAMTLLTFIAVEVSYDTSVDYVVAAQQVNRIRAYYAAKSAVEISLLRIMLYKQAASALGGNLGGNASMLDPIWSFPFMWPPTEALAATNATEVDKDMMKEAVADSLMQNVRYSATISPEGGKLDINDLGSDVQTLKKSMIQQVLKIFQAEVKNNERFAKKYSGYRFEELVNNIADYIDADSESLNGGDESAAYMDPGEKDVKLPPNRGLRTVDELHQVAGMKDEFYNVLAPRITVFGTKGINVNYANKEMLMALDPTMTEEAVQKVIARRSDVKIGGPFRDDQDFFSFLQPFGVDIKAIQDSKINLLYGMEFNFRVTATGFAANVQRQITAVTYDFTNLAPRLAQLLDQQDQAQGLAPSTGIGTPTPGGTATPAAPKYQVSKGRPTVVYWEEN